LAEKEDDYEDLSDNDQDNTNQDTSEVKSKLHLSLPSQSQEGLLTNNGRDLLIMTEDLNPPTLNSEQSKSRSSFASSDFCSVSLKSSSLQVDDIRY
jgi:hypothetical protein